MAIGIQIEGLAEMEARLGAMGAELESNLAKALADSAALVATRAQAIAPRRSGRLRASITPVTEGATAEVRVTAKRASRRYPGGYPYPARIERSQPFLAQAVQQQAKAVEARMTQVLDEIEAQWGGG